MAALSQPEDNSEHVTPMLRKENKCFIAKETPDQRCDVKLVVEDGKEFKAHKHVLSEASPFFEKLLNSPMKESREGIVRLEMFSESAMRDTLQFIYTGDVQILAEENAKDLVVSADYFLLPSLKPLAERALVGMLNTSNCISVYYLCQTYQCQELLAKTKKYILANFTSLYETNREEVLNMSSKEMEMWLSSDDINVSAEEDVYKIILAWINHDRNKRQKYFAELFHHVRLVFALRDFLSSDILMNDLVKDNDSCLNRAVEAINFIDSQNYGNLSTSPRKSLETSVIVVTSAVRPNRELSKTVPSNWDLSGQPILCYFPGEGRWCKLGEMPREWSGQGEFIFCRGKLYGKKLGSFRKRLDWRLFEPLTIAIACYNPYSNCWTKLPYVYGGSDRVLREIFVGSDNEIYALESEKEAVAYRRERWYREALKEVEYEETRYVSFIRKYKVESNSWEDVTSFRHLRRKQDFCIVSKDDFVYCIGGVERCGKLVVKIFTDVYRYDLSRSQWDKVADIQEPKTLLSGIVCNGKIFITGKVELGMNETSQCEVYSETTNEWQFIASLNIRPEASPKLLSADDQLYALGSCMWNEGDSTPDTRVECYDADKNEWILKTEIPIRIRSNSRRAVNAYSARIFKGFLSNHQLKSHNPWRYFPEVGEGNCVIM